MVNRKKRLKKGIKSMSRQIKLHEKKCQEVKEEGNFELEEYYGHEIENLRKVKKQKEKLLD